MDKLNLNLDGMSAADLITVSNVLTTLAAYAKQKARAMNNREIGDIQAAQAQERQCDIYYKALPDWARW